MSGTKYDWKQPIDPNRRVPIPSEAKDEIRDLYMRGINERMITRIFNFRFSSVVSFISTSGIRAERKEFRERYTQQVYDKWVKETEEGNGL